MCERLNNNNLEPAFDYYTKETGRNLQNDQGGNSVGKLFECVLQDGITQRLFLGTPAQESIRGATANFTQRADDEHYRTDLAINIFDDAGKNFALAVDATTVGSKEGKPMYMFDKIVCSVNSRRTGRQIVPEKMPFGVTQLFDEDSGKRSFYPRFVLGVSQNSFAPAIAAGPIEGPTPNTLECDFMLSYEISKQAELMSELLPDEWSEHQEDLAQLRDTIAELRNWSNTKLVSLYDSIVNQNGAESLKWDGHPGPEHRDFTKIKFIANRLKREDDVFRDICATIEHLDADIHDEDTGELKTGGAGLGGIQDRSVDPPVYTYNNANYYHIKTNFPPGQP